MPLAWSWIPCEVSAYIPLSELPTFIIALARQSMQLVYVLWLVGFMDQPATSQGRGNEVAQKETA